RGGGAARLPWAALGGAFEERPSRGERAILFPNRRGLSPHTQCRSGGHVPTCPSCDIALTLHLAPRRLWRCHYCDHQEPAEGRCPSCGAALLRFSGAGTQRVERELSARLKQARVLRLDTDVARQKQAAEILAAFAPGDA